MPLVSQEFQSLSTEPRVMDLTSTSDRREPQRKERLGVSTSSRTENESDRREGLQMFSMAEMIGFLARMNLGVNRKRSVRGVHPPCLATHGQSDEPAPHARTCANFTSQDAITRKLTIVPGTAREYPVDCSNSHCHNLADSGCNRVDDVGTRASAEETLLTYIIDRLDGWQEHLCRLSNAGANAGLHLPAVDAALVQLGEELLLMRGNLRTLAATSDTYSVTDGPEDVVCRYILLHERSSTFIFSYEELCRYMSSLSTWKLCTTAVPTSLVFWHFHHRNVNGQVVEEHDACAVLSYKNIMRLTRGEAYNFVDAVNSVEGAVIFRVFEGVVPTPH